MTLNLAACLLPCFMSEHNLNACQGDKLFSDIDHK